MRSAQQDVAAVCDECGASVSGADGTACCRYAAADGARAGQTFRSALHQHYSAARAGVVPLILLPADQLPALILLPADQLPALPAAH